MINDHFCSGCMIKPANRVNLPDNWQRGDSVPPGLTVHSDGEDGRRFVYIGDAFYNRRVYLDAKEIPQQQRAVSENSLLRMMEMLMTKMDDLMGLLTSIGTDVSSAKSQIDDLHTQLTTLQASTPPDVDLQPAIDIAASIKASLEGTTTSVNAAQETQQQGG